MQLKIDLPEMTVRKMRALDALQGSDSGDFLEMLAEYIDQAVTMQIATRLGLVRESDAYASDSPPKATRQASTPTREDPRYAVAEGLSDESFEDVPEEEEQHITGKASQLSIASIAKDNEVSDPETEAVSPDNTEMTFGEALDLMGGPSLMDSGDAPLFSEIPEIPLSAPPPRKNVKKLPKGIKATVSEYGGVDSEPK